MLNPYSIPTSVCKLLSGGMTSSITIDDEFEHRPDNILKSTGQSSVYYELLDNNISCTSPISMTKGTEYTAVSIQLASYFGRK